MNTPENKFEAVTLLITHYNRSGSLERLLKSFDALNCAFSDIVVSDDGSKPEHIQRLAEIQLKYPFRLITAERNRGLGNNINKGQDAVTTPYTLYVQEDFVPKDIFPEKFKYALGLLNEHPEFDMARFYAYFEYPFLANCKEGFCEMKFSKWPWYFSYRKFYAYSDHPHLRRSTFFQKFGRYPEGIKGDATEYSMMMSFLQKGGKSIFYRDFKGLFDQKNSDEEPSTMTREYWRQTEMPLIAVVRNIYRHLKFNFDFNFKNYQNTGRANKL